MGTTRHLQDVTDRRAMLELAKQQLNLEKEIVRSGLGGMQLAESQRQFNVSTGLSAASSMGQFLRTAAGLVFVLFLIFGGGVFEMLRVVFTKVPIVIMGGIFIALWMVLRR